MKLDNETKDVMRELIKSRTYLPHTHGLDIAKFLDPVDNKLDLWFLEVAVRNSIRFTRHALGDSEILSMNGLQEYYKLRGITDDHKKRQEETIFIMNFIASIERDECSPGTAIR